MTFDKSLLDLEFLISFKESEIDIFLKVPYKFPRTLDRCIS